MYARRLLLAGFVFPLFTLSAQQQGVSSGATMAAAARIARLVQARARSAAIDAVRFAIVAADLSHVGSLGRLHSGVFVGALNNEARAAKVVRLPARRLDLHPTLVGGSVWVTYAESEGTVDLAKHAIDETDGPPDRQPTVSFLGDCLSLWLIFPGGRICW